MSLEMCSALEDIQYKYERLTSLIDILQMLTAEIVEIAGAPSGSLAEGLYEFAALLLCTGTRSGAAALARGTRTINRM